MNLNLPKHTEVNKFIPKNKFFNKIFVSTKVKNEFTGTIKRITWKYKLSERTINTAKTKNVEEIQVFEIELKKQTIPKQALKIIDKTIHYKILYILKYEDNFLYAVAVKTEKEARFYFSKWNQELNFNFNAINLEILYQNIVKKFIDTVNTDDKDFNEILNIDNRIKKLKREILALKNKIRKEKQFNKKVELNEILKQKEKILKGFKKNI